jgi:hypothetical protein
MSTDSFDQPAYYLDHFNRVDDDWFIVAFKDPSQGDSGGLKVTVSGDVLNSLLRQAKVRPLSGAEVTQLDGK